MGLQNGRLRNTQMTASSQWDKYHAPFLGRLHRTRHGKYVGAWCARSNNRYQYLQVDFKRPVKIIKLSTQGRQDVSQWVTQYYIKHSVTAINFVEYKERNSRTYFTGNRDRNTVMTNPFNPAIRARYIRVCPWGWYRHISMRVEFYGCFTGEHFADRTFNKSTTIFPGPLLSTIQMTSTCSKLNRNQELQASVVSLQSFEHFDVISMFDKSINHGKLLSICFFYNNLDGF